MKIAVTPVRVGKNFCFRWAHTHTYTITHMDHQMVNYRFQHFSAQKHS